MHSLTERQNAHILSFLCEAYFPMLPGVRFMCCCIAVERLYSCPFAESFALLTDVVSQHSSKHEVLGGSEFMHGFVDECLHHLQAYGVSEVKVHLTFSYRLFQVGDALAFKPFTHDLGASRTHGAEHQLAHTLAVFVNLVHEQLHGIVSVEIFC